MSLWRHQCSPTTLFSRWWARRRQRHCIATPADMNRRVWQSPGGACRIGR